MRYAPARVASALSSLTTSAQGATETWLCPCACACGAQPMRPGTPGQHLMLHIEGSTHVYFTTSLVDGHSASPTNGSGFYSTWLTDQNLQLAVTTDDDDAPLVRSVSAAAAAGEAKVKAAAVRVSCQPTGFVHLLAAQQRQLRLRQERWPERRRWHLQRQPWYQHQRPHRHPSLDG